jgi:hypothetical protein
VVKHFVERNQHATIYFENVWRTQKYIFTDINGLYRSTYVSFHTTSQYFRHLVSSASHTNNSGGFRPIGRGVRHGLEPPTHIYLWPTQIYGCDLWPTQLSHILAYIKINPGTNIAYEHIVNITTCQCKQKKTYKFQSDR